MTAGFSASAVHAAPGDEDPASVAPPTLPLTQLGSRSVLAFYGTQGTETLTIPVPQGLQPAELTAIVEVPVNLQTGTLDVTQDERTISRVPLPTGDRQPIVVPLAGVNVVNNAVTLTLRSYLVPLQGYCLDPTNPLRLTDSEIRYDGAEIAPRTVADFLPPVLRKLTLFVPAVPTNAESDGALRLATAVVARYGRQNPEIVVLPLAPGQTDPPESSVPMERQIVVREIPEVGVGLRGASGIPWLLVSGPSDRLASQARMLSSNVSQLAVSSNAVVGPLKSTPQLPADVTTIRALGQPGVNATALNPQVTIALDQTRLGRSVRNVRVHLRGSYTPLPSSVGGSVVAAINGETIDHWSTDGTGAIDRWVAIPDRLLQRYTNLGVAINIAGNTGRCGEFQPVTLTIDGDSPVESKQADPPLIAGLQSVPQALMPRMEIGLGQDRFADTSRALAILVGLQRLSALPMDTEVVSLQEAIDSPNPAILIASDGWSDQAITLPVAVNASGELKVAAIDGSSDATTLTLSPAQRFGSLQTVFDGRRPLLIATSDGAPDQIDALLTWLNADPVRWSRLTGTAVLAPAGRDPVTFGSDTPLPAAPSAERDERPFWWLGGGLVAVAVAGAGLMWWRTRRATPSD
ncbi:hypothetical protein [Mycolicibacterium sp.]|uniref:hypothetical protein n=1 Tax=Mycolicibacterium sp. TaxID=2320850 RepID=UPI0025F76A62|nr:hypothetical protein [Mycolicibacterium sp.]